MSYATLDLLSFYVKMDFGAIFIKLTNGLRQQAGGEENKVWQTAHLPSGYEIGLRGLNVAYCQVSIR